MKNFTLTTGKALTTFLLVFLFSSQLTMAQNQYRYSDSWGKQGITLQQSRNNSATVNYSINQFTLEDQEFNGKGYKTIQLPGNILPNNAGAPNLPGKGYYIAIPQGAQAELRIVNARKETIKNVEISPAPVIPLDTDREPMDYREDAKIYTENAFYPAQPIALSQNMKVRGVDAVMLGITPFQYNPVTKELVVYRDIEIEVEFKGGNGHFGEDRLRSMSWDPMLEDILLNADQLPEIDYSSRYKNHRDGDGFEYLIISPDGDDYQQWADTIRRFRNRQGILTGIVTLSEIGGNTPNAIETYIDDAYKNWTIPPSAIMMLGDYGSSMDNSITSPVYNNYCVSDNILGDVNNDHMPDIIMARMTAQNATHLETMITKFINYETNPPTNPDFYDHPITAMGWQTERWFQICSEVVNGFLEHHLGKNPVRENAIYQGSTSTWSSATNTSTVVDYFGPDGLGYIPATPTHLTDWGGNATRVNNDINDGAFMLQHRDHGGEDGWGEPAYHNSNINGLHNTDLTFIFSINCLTGKYNIGGECFAEKFHRHTNNGQNAGALGLIAASEVSYSFVNDTYVWGMYDNMWPDFMPDYGSNPESRGIKPAFGNAAGKYFLKQSSWPYNTNNKEVTYHLFHAHCDAYLNLYSEVPENLTVMHDDVLVSGPETFEVTADENSIIALSVDDEIIGVAEGTGGPVAVEIASQLPGSIVTITVTKQNFYRYEQSIQVIPPAGPYLIKESFTCNDEAGNDNGLVDFSEEILMTLELKNVGNEDADNVVATLTSEDEYVTITDNTEDFGTVAANSTAVKEDAFKFVVSDSVPDQHKIIFTYEATNGDQTWDGSILVVANAPVFEIGNMIISDPTGNNNGRLDPGETVNMSFETRNIGHATSASAMGRLVAIDPFVAIEQNIFSFGPVEAGSTQNASFIVSADAATPLGSMSELAYTVKGGYYEAEKSYNPEIGLVLEDFETGDFTAFEWSQTGDVDWVIDSTNPKEGTYCAVSGDVDDSKEATLELEYEVLNPSDMISFWVKTSSEGGYDFLKFYIDGEEQGKWSGSTEYTFVEFPVSNGTHTFKWTYDKDYSTSSGQDCAWIDYIVLPAETKTQTFAGQDAVSCSSETYELNGYATNCNAVAWSTSGTGSFDDNTSLNPVYTASDEDMNNGSVVLTLTGTEAKGDVVDEMTLYFDNMPEIDLGENQSVCADQSVTLDATSNDATEYLWLPGEETTPTLTVDTTGQGLGTFYYTVVASSEHGCQALDEVVINFYICNVMQEGTVDLGVKVYPNPARNSFNVEIEGQGEERVNIRMMNAFGAIVMQELQVATTGKVMRTINLSGYAQGIYYLYIDSKNCRTVKKVIIQK